MFLNEYICSVVFLF